MFNISKGIKRSLCTLLCLTYRQSLKITPLLKSVRATLTSGNLGKAGQKYAARNSPFTASLLPTFQMLKHILETPCCHCIRIQTLWSPIKHVFTIYWGHYTEENGYGLPLIQPQGVTNYFNLCWFQAQNKQRLRSG